MKNPINNALIKTITSKTGTPVYIYSKEKIINNLNVYRTAFKQSSPLYCYAMKANSSYGIASLLASEGIGADVVSGGELYRALRAGFEPDKIIFSGVGKTEEELSFAIKSRLLFINLESLEEFAVLERVACKLKLPAGISVRLNPDVDPHTHKFISTGKSGSKFGVTAPEALAIYKAAAASRYLKPKALHFHLGSQINSSRPYILAFKKAESLISKLTQLGIKLEYLDIGGGWGIPEGSDLPSPVALGRAVELKTQKLGLKLILEPGRSLVASAGVLAAKVLYRKKSGGKHFIVTDTGMNDLMRPALYGAKHPIIPLKPGQGAKLKVVVTGPVCESGDFLAESAIMPLPQQGDILLVQSAGAYGFSMSSQYNSRPRAAEVLVTGPDKWKLIRRRETYKDLIKAEL